MIQTLRIDGTDKQLYKLVAPLVMDPEVLKQNNNYPFKTNDTYVWFIAIEAKVVVGFIPVEQRGRSAIINNYYLKNEAEEAFSLLITDVISAFAEEKSISAVVQIQHQTIFEKQGFKIEKIWKLYVKMRRD